MFVTIMLYHYQIVNKLYICSCKRFILLNLLSITILASFLLSRVFVAILNYVAFTLYLFFSTNTFCGSADGL